MHRQKYLCASAAALVLLTTGTVKSQCQRWEAGPLSAPPNPSANGQVLAMTVWDADGAGPQAPALVIGGTFTEVGGVAANRVAVWNGFHWASLGPGFNGTVLALGVFNGQVIAGGDFTNTGGFPVNHIARFNGASWQALGLGTSGGSPSGQVSALTVFNNELIVGGSFTAAGGFNTPCIARWNGSIWGTVGSGMAMSGNDPRVECLTVFENQLYAGGFFTSAGGTSANNIARWNGSSWSKLGLSFGGNGADGLVRCFLIHDFGGTVGENLVLGGSFSSVAIGSVTINTPAIARWSGGTWGALGPGLPGATVGGLAQDSVGVLAGGFFPGPFNSIARWRDSQSAWEPLNGGGIDLGSVQSMITYDHPAMSEYIVIGGAFQGAGGKSLQNLVKHFENNSNFEPLEAPFEPFAYAKLGTKLVAGGFGSQVTASGPVDNLMAWDGLAMTKLGSSTPGPNGYVNALAASGNVMAVGGFFSTVGGIPASHVALWNDVAPQGWSAMGAGFNAEVLALTVFRNKFVAGGFFNLSGGTTVNGIARWNGSAWTSLTTGLMNGASSGRAFAFTTRTVGNISNPQHQLIVGGSFTTAGGVAANNVVAYFENEVLHPLNGWITFGSGFNGRANALAMHSGSIYAGGEFTLSGNGVTPLNHIARWTGTTWEQVGPGLTSSVHALLSEGGVLYALIGGLSPGLVKWDGSSWSTVGALQSAKSLGNPFALAAFQNEIHIGGRFDSVNSGQVFSPRWARYLATGAPWVAQSSGAQNVNCGDIAEFSVLPAMGYSDVTYTWIKGFDIISNGPTGYGSMISGADAAMLTIINAQPGDVSDYQCVIANACGSSASAGTTLELTDIACCPGDIVGNGGDVNIDDLIAVITSWGPCPSPPANCLANVNFNGIVNIDDLVVVIIGWGACR